MHRAARIIPLAILATVALDGCRRRQEPAVVPVAEPAPTPTETCGPACRDSIEAARRAEEEARREEARRAAIAKARADLLATIFFDYDMSEITADSRAKLDAKVPVLTQNPGLRIRVAGHTDSRGSDAYNLALGQRRAAAAKRYLTDRGIDGTRIEIVSFGEERPTCTEEDESCWSRNRRDEFEITAGGETITVQITSGAR